MPSRRKKMAKNITIDEQALIPAFADFLYNPQDKRLYFRDEKGVIRPVGDSTYERPLWTPPWYNFWSASRYFNPSHYATSETATRVASWVLSVSQSALVVSIRDNWDVLGTISAPERKIVVRNIVTGVEEEFNAGLLAFSIDKNGETAARRSFRAELKLAGVIA